MSRRQYGITGPVSTAGPTPQDRVLNESMIHELKEQNSFESEEEGARRTKALALMQRLTKEFVYRVSLKRHMSDGMARDAGGKVFTFGSYRLGVYGPGSDIDTLVVVPKHVSREAFFEDMVAILREQPELEEIAAVPEAFVPIIKIKLMGISIDLICARLDLAQIPENLTLEDNNLLKNTDEKDQRALNGTRVTDAILALVPEKTVFRHALRTIKLWAQRRAIYANIIGFPGGVAWAMMVARICQLYPNAIAATIVNRFFYIYSMWKWPQPVMLTKIEDGPLPVRIWNPQLYTGDRAHRMPIITPAYPAMCATHNVTASTHAIIKKELERGAKITQEIFDGQLSWDALFEKHRFFHDYKYYMAVMATSKGDSEQHLGWSGWIESRLRLLVQKLELIPDIEIAHPFNKPFEQEFLCSSEEEARSVADGKPLPTTQLLTEGMETEKEKTENVIEEGKFVVRATSLFIGLDIRPSDESRRQINLQWPCQEFHETVKMWPQYDDDLYCLALRVVKAHQLPDMCFPDGEERPTKRRKAKPGSPMVKRVKAT